MLQMEINIPYALSGDATADSRHEVAVTTIGLPVNKQDRIKRDWIRYFEGNLAEFESYRKTLVTG